MRTLYLFALVLLICPHRSSTADAPVAAPLHVPQTLQYQMEILVEHFANKRLFTVSHTENDSYLPLIKWKGVKFYKRKEAQVKSLRWNDKHLGGTMHFSKLPRTLFSLFIENNSFNGNLDASELPRPLQILMAQKNNLSGTIAWQNLPPKLTVFSIGENRFTGDVFLDKVPASLVSLALDGNQFGKVIGEKKPGLAVSGHLKNVRKPRSISKNGNVHELPEDSEQSSASNISQNSSYQHSSFGSSSSSARRELFPDYQDESGSRGPSFWDTEQSSLYETDDTYDFDTDGSLSAIQPVFDDVYSDPSYISPILSHAELDESFESSSLEEEKRRSSSSLSALLSAIGGSITRVFRLLLWFCERLIRLFLLPISQPYPSSADFTHF